MRALLIWGFIFFSLVLAETCYLLKTAITLYTLKHCYFLKTAITSYINIAIYRS